MDSVQKINLVSNESKSTAGSDETTDSNINLLEEHFEEINLEDNACETIDQINELIKKYIRFIRLDCADEAIKKKMIKNLCELRVKQCELLEEEGKDISGHQFKLETSNNSCDLCTKKQSSLFFPLLNNLSNYSLKVCIHCGYSIHCECQLELFSHKKIKKCPKLIYECQDVKKIKNIHDFVILDICIEKSLSEQEYKCKECETFINFETSSLCDYDGYYYCKNCHNNDLSLIPARILHNWDFIPRPVSKSSLYKLNFIQNKPILFDLLKYNSMLYGFVDELPILKRLRLDINLMVKYVLLCKQPNKPKIIIKNHLIDSNLINCYSILELNDLDGLKKNLTVFHSELFDHITKTCETCKGNGFYCELCPDKGDILFPFSPNISLCPKCHAVYHKNCFYRKKTCTRCKRIEKKEFNSVSNVVLIEKKTEDDESDKINEKFNN